MFDFIVTIFVVVNILLVICGFNKRLKKILIKMIGEKNAVSYISIAQAILLALIFRSSIASPYKIPSGSMIPTLKIGDFIFVSKLSYGIKVPFTNHNFINFSQPKRGDVIVFIEPKEEKVDFIKRVVGVPGDKIELKNDKLFINDQPAEREVYSDPEVVADLPSPMKEASTVYKEKIDGKDHFAMEILKIAENFGPVTVPAGKLFMMGDNRDNSQDSRYWGYLPIENVRGRALFIWLSLDSYNPYFKFGFTIPFLNWDCLPSLRFHRLGHKVI